MHICGRISCVCSLDFKHVELQLILIWSNKGSCWQHWYSGGTEMAYRPSDLIAGQLLMNNCRWISSPMQQPVYVVVRAWFPPSHPSKMNFVNAPVRRLINNGLLWVRLGVYSTIERCLFESWQSDKLLGSIWCSLTSRPPELPSHDILTF